MCLRNNILKQVIKDLDEKKNRAVRKAWEQVNKDFGSIFSTLLPGARVKLQTLEGRPVTDGLEVKVLAFVSENGACYFVVASTDHLRYGGNISFHAVKYFSGPK